VILVVNGLTLAEAARFIERKYGPRAGALTPLVAGGWSSAYAVTIDGQDVVVRFGAYGDDFVKDQVMAAHTSELLPIPEVLEIGEAPGGYVIVARRAYGGFLDDLDADGMRAILPQLLTALRETWRIDVSATTGYGGWAPDGAASHPSWRDALMDIANVRPNPRLQGWRESLEASPTGAASWDAGVAALRALVERCPEDRRIIHNDLLHRNVLVQDGKLSAILDWGNSMYGDGVYDLALLTYAWHWYPQWSDIDLRGMIGEFMANDQGGVEPLNLDDRLRCYQLHLSLDSQSYTAFIRDWDDLAEHALRTQALIEGAP